MTDPRDTPYDGGLPADGPALDHLWNAAHEMLRAMRTLLDAADEFVEAQRAGVRGPARDDATRGRVHRIDLDLQADDGPAAPGGACANGARREAGAGADAS